MKKVVLLAVIVSLMAGCNSQKKRTTQESQFTVNTVVGNNPDGTQKVSISTTNPGNGGAYNVNVSVGGTGVTNSSKLLSNQPPSKNLWYSTTNPEAKNVLAPTSPIKPSPKTDSSRARIDPNNNQIIWMN